jgi:hypothetical protein
VVLPCKRRYAVRMFEVTEAHEAPGFLLHEWVEVQPTVSWVVPSRGMEVRRVEERVFRRVVRGEVYASREAAGRRITELKGLELDRVLLKAWFGAWGGGE